MGASASVLDEEEYKSLQEQISKGQAIRDGFTAEENPPNKTMRGTITRIGYAAFGIKLDSTEKVIYIMRFPPTNGTVIPLLDEPSSVHDLKTDEHVTMEEATEFWSSPTSRQVNGLWKGGSWGLDNLMGPHTKWCTDAWVGDTVTLQFMKNGVLKFGFGIPGFPEDESGESAAEALPNTMNTTWSLNITVDKTGQKYAGYGMNYFMPQYANDLLFVWKDPATGKRLVKICKRGNAPTVDMQNKLMPGAGEHLEPGEAFCFKASLTRAFREELGVEDVALAKCCVLDLGKFDDPGRDPRYWNFYYKHKENSGEKEGEGEGKGREYESFGMKRYSTTHGFVLYYHGEAPLLTVPEDDVEVQQLGPSEKRWLELDSLDVSSDAWMIEDHSKIVLKAQASVAGFDLLSEEEKKQYLYNIDENSDSMTCYKHEESSLQEKGISNGEENKGEEKKEEAIKVAEIRKE